MNLWSINIEELTFDQLDKFLQQKLPEGYRLDYKAQAPKDIQETICAFANTMGGMIVIGVEEDSDTNTPIWPPENVNLLQDAKSGLDMWLFQKATEAVYPPVSIRISRTIPNENAEGKVLLVIRVDQSSYAPHAIDNGKRVVICERVGNMKINHAHIDEVQTMFERRQKLEDKREEMVKEELTRSMQQLPQKELPIRWISIIPIFPDRIVAEREKCFRVLEKCPRHILRSPRPFRFPGGGYAEYSTTSSIVDATARISEYGHLFMAEVCREVIDKWDEVRYMGTFGRGNGIFDLYEETLKGTKNHAVNFLEYDADAKFCLEAVLTYRQILENPIESPTLVQVSYGYINVQKRRMRDSKNKFLDSNLKVKAIRSMNELIENPSQQLEQLIQDVLYGFGVQTGHYRSENYRGEWERMLTRSND